MHWRGERLHLGSPREALERGIGMVYQEMLCFPNLTVTGNIFAGRELTRGGRLRHAEMRERTRALLAELHLRDLARRARRESLSAAYRQLLQVARALAFECQHPGARRADDGADRRRRRITCSRCSRS